MRYIIVYWYIRNTLYHRPDDWELSNKQKVKYAGWGKFFDMYKRRSKPPSSTSCFVTNQGPVANHFQPCIPEEVRYRHALDSKILEIPHYYPFVAFYGFFFA